MKLDRNKTKQGRGKYAIVRLRKLKGRIPMEGGNYVVPKQFLDFGTRPGTEFFVMRFRDRFTAPALAAYAHAIRERIAEIEQGVCKDADKYEREDLLEYAMEIEALVRKAEATETRNPD